jgi:AcrR family transcriptional regulator
MRPPRVYRSELRQQQAEQTRRRVLATAGELFAADGYARTTLAKIAAVAGVSADTVQGHGPKAALMIAAIEYAAVGVSGEESILNLDIGRQILAIDDYAQAVDFVVEAQLGMHQRTALLAQALFGGAGSDPELQRYQTEFIAGVDSQVWRVLDIYRDRGWVRGDVPFDELVQTVAVLGSVATYLKLVHGEGWSIPAYRAWSRRTLEETVLVPPQGN